MTKESNRLQNGLNVLQSEMLSLRMDNNRLNQLVNRGHMAVPENNSERTDEANKNRSQPQLVAADKKPDFDNLTLPAKNLGMNQCSTIGAN